MWSKISNVLKSRQPHDDAEPSVSQGEVMSRVYEQHPNLSVFHSASELPFPTPSPPSSPSKHGRRGMFKRISRTPKDDPSLRGPSPMKLPIGLPKKVKSTLNFNGNSSQSSLARASSDTGHPPPNVARPPSRDMLRPRSPQDPTWPPMDIFRRPSLDMLRPSQDASRPSQDALRPQDHSNTLQNSTTRRPITPIDPNPGSVRSILRDPKTPGTGQNVRFFSRDAYKVISPDQSMDTEYQSQLQSQPQSQSQPQPQQQEISFLDRLQRRTPENSNVPAVMARSSSYSKAARPSIVEVFSPLRDTNDSKTAPPPDSHSLMTPIPPPDFSNLFDMSQRLELPTIPPGLGFDVEEPLLDSAVELNETEIEGEHSEKAQLHTAMTSTPYRDLGKGKARDNETETEKENIPIDETIFHAKEKSPRLPSILHDRSQSFSFGQTVFYSLANNSNISPSPSPSSAAKSPTSDKDKDSRPSTSPVGRSRAMSDTAFQNMMRSSPKPPEADINDESSSDLVVYSGGSPEPDPFRVNATTYYTPQTMIPTTPPKEVVTPSRKTSKEESIIFSLQTQLALQKELCGQYETDLRARDELVEILGKKLGDTEKEEGKRRAALRAWKKKVAELEKTCRYLEEEVDGSRQESLERSVMDEASGEALRMLHRQIAGLEREKGEWGRKEVILREEMGTLEGLVKERSEDVMKLKETLLKRDESERELKEGIREAKEQMEQMGNLSFAGVDEDDLRRLVIESEQKGEEEKERHRVTEIRWEEERAELTMKVEGMKMEKEALEGELKDVKLKLSNQDEEFGMLKLELEAQWEHTEKATEKIETLKGGRGELEQERDALKGDVEELQERMGNLEIEWNESENRRTELEGEIQELWDAKEALEKERDQLEEQLHSEHEHAEDLTQTLQKCEDRISELDQERQYALDNVSRLEENIRKRDAESADYSQRVVQREGEAEQLREQMAGMKREHSRVLDEQNRALQEFAGQEGEARMHMEVLIRQKAEADVEMRTVKDRVGALKDEVERLRRQVHELQQESADKEVKMLQVTKQRAQDKEDLQGLNIALDSKQQELELLKRRLGVRGTAGSTPAQPSKIAPHRRDSSVFTTPSVSRPSSVISDSGKDGITLHKDRKSADTPSTTAKIPALGKSVRVNGNAAGSTLSSSTSSKPTRGIEGSMGPPPGKPRSSVAGTPTPTARIPRSSSVKHSAHPSTPVPISRGRVSSVNLERSESRTKFSRQVVNASPALSCSDVDEKENINVAQASKRSMIPMPA